MPAQLLSVAIGAWAQLTSFSTCTTSTVSGSGNTAEPNQALTGISTGKRGMRRKLKRVT